MRHLNQKNSQGELGWLLISIQQRNYAKRITTQCTFVENPLDALIPSLKAKKIDAIMSSLSITEKTSAQEPAFVRQPYAADSRLWWWRKFDIICRQSSRQRQTGVVLQAPTQRRSVMNIGHQKALKSSRIRGRQHLLTHRRTADARAFQNECRCQRRFLSNNLVGKIG